MPHVIEIFLPQSRGDGSEVEADKVERLVSKLADRFGGATAYIRSPAEGLWKDGGQTIRDRIVIVEVMVDELDRSWWRDFRTSLEANLQQEEILIRATPTRRL